MTPVLHCFNFSRSHESLGRHMGKSIVHWKESILPVRVRGSTYSEYQHSGGRGDPVLKVSH